MQIAVLGAGRVGSTFAFHLARAGHDVTLVARGGRFEALQREGAIMTVSGERAAVNVASALDPAQPYALVLVTVLAHQVDAVLPALQASAAHAVLFMFNSFELVARLRDAVGAQRFAFAFPTVTAFFVDGKLKSAVKGPGLGTTVTSAQWAGVFNAAGIPTTVEPDIDSFLRSHAAFVVPLMAAACRTFARGAGLTWAEAGQHTAALAEAFALVRALGNRLTPAFVGFVARVPAGVLTAIVWGASRLAPVRALGEFGPAEARALIDAMAAAAPGKTPMLLAIRP